MRIYFPFFSQHALPDHGPSDSAVNECEEPVGRLMKKRETTEWVMPSLSLSVKTMCDSDVSFVNDSFILNKSL